MTTESFPSRLNPQYSFSALTMKRYSTLQHTKFAERSNHILVNIDQVIPLKCLVPSALHNGILKMFFNKLLDVHTMYRIGESDL